LSIDTHKIYDANGKKIKIFENPYLEVWEALVTRLGTVYSTNAWNITKLTTLFAKMS
jgi:hypothetical protein